MVVKILGALDIFIAICFALFGLLGMFPYNFIMILGAVLLIKGLAFGFILNIISILDIISGLIILISYYGMPKPLVLFVALFLVQKGIFSMLSD